MSQQQAVIRATQTATRPSATADGNHDASLRFWPWPLVVLLVAAGWAVRNGHYYEAGDDFGYYLGVIGGLMLLALLLYSLRKHIRFMHNWGATKYWFRLHMFLGITGPTLILFHSTFRAGSLNATVALSCMLLVAGSGVIGRVIYRKIHHGLYGRSATLQEVQANLGIIGGDVKSKFHFAPHLETRLKAFETSALTEHGSAWVRFWLFATVGMRAGWTYYMVTKELERIGRDHARKHEWDAVKLEKRLVGGKMAIRRYLDAVIDVARFSAYERLFSLWHVLHVPFVFMLIISGIAHVIAVHMY
ncbi:MAG: pyridine nucleotide-disulfide oxidoreductase [Gammaproteobacteria bacterium]|nr:pyridine nucleotide-disulfide oxidoreductase [Gammaproteobacteria bacterium]